MELMWMLLITVAAVACAYVFGEMLDRKAQVKQQALDQAAREEWIAGLANFSWELAKALSEKSLIAAYMIPAAAKTASRKILEAEDLTLSDAEWALLLNALEKQKAPSV